MDEWLDASCYRLSGAVPRVTSQWPGGTRYGSTGCKKMLEFTTSQLGGLESKLRGMEEEWQTLRKSCEEAEDIAVAADLTAPPSTTQRLGRQSLCEPILCMMAWLAVAKDLTLSLAESSKT